MVYSDKIYDSVWCNFSTEEELQAILDEAQPPKLTNQNFKINTWNYTAKNVPRITAENLGHEWPDSTPFWWNIENSYKSAAKGFSEELVGKEVTRLCSYLNLRARPTFESVAIYTIDVNQYISHALQHQKGFLTDWDIPYQVKLTGQFVDMPDGRWHYVYIVDALRLNTALFSWNFLPKQFVEEQFIAEFMEFSGRKPTQKEIDDYKSSQTDFRFAFVREDLIGQLQHPEFFDIEYLKKFVGDESELTNRGWSDFLYKDYPYWLPANSITITYEEYGNKALNVSDIVLSLLPKSKRKEIEEARMSLAATFAHYPGWYKPAGEPAYLVRKQSRPTGELAQEIYKLVTGDRYGRYDYRKPLDCFRELIPGYQYPGFYQYEYAYYENAEKGLSYLYFLLPAYDLSHLKNTSYMAYFGDKYPRQRVTAYENGGNSEYMKEWADEVKSETEIEEDSGVASTGEDVVDRNILAGAGAVALGLIVLNKWI